MVSFVFENSVGVVKTLLNNTKVTELNYVNRAHDITEYRKKINELEPNFERIIKEWAI